MGKRSLSTFGRYAKTWLLFMVGWLAYSVLKDPVAQIVRHWWKRSGPKDLFVAMTLASLYVAFVLWQEWRRHETEKRRLPWQGSLPDRSR